MSAATEAATEITMSIARMSFELKNLSRCNFETNFSILSIGRKSLVQTQIRDTKKRQLLSVTSKFTCAFIKAELRCAIQQQGTIQHLVTLICYKDKKLKSIKQGFTPPILGFEGTDLTVILNIFDLFRKRHLNFK